MTFMFVNTLYVIWSQHNGFQHKNAGPATCLSKRKNQKVIISIGASHWLHHKSASHRHHMTDYRENGKFWSKPYENEILIKPNG